jgi:hypothetical protein
VTSRSQILLEVVQRVARSSTVPLKIIAHVYVPQLPPQDHHHTPSSTPMTDLDMDSNDIHDIAPTMTHHGVLTVAEANTQLEALAPLNRCNMRHVTVK